MRDGATRILHYLEPLLLQEQALTAHEEEILDDAAGPALTAQSVQELMDVLWRTTRRVCPCDRMGLAFVMEAGQRVVSSWVRADYNPVLLDKGFNGDLRGTSLEPVIKTGRPRIINDMERYLAENPKSHAARLLAQEGIRSSLTCPVVVEDRTVGFLFRDSRQAWAMTEKQARFHIGLAQRLAPAFERAYREELLHAASRDYLEMLGFVSHELKSPIASLVMDGHVLAEGCLGPLEERQVEKIRKMVRKGEYLLDLIRGFLDLSRIEGGELKLRPFKGVNLVTEVIEPAIELVQAQIDQKKMQLLRMFPEIQVGAECDPALLKVVVVNLLGNAVKYGLEGGQIRIHLNRTLRRLDVAVWNEGLGFSEAERPWLYQKFSRLRQAGPKGPKGTGLGLYNAWRIIQLHSGKADAFSDPGRWAEFTFSIPQPLPLPGEN